MSELTSLQGDAGKRFLEVGKEELTVTPYRDWLMVNQTAAQEMSPGGVALPSKFQCPVSSGIVLKVGPGYRTDNGVWISTDESDIKPGDTVYWATTGGTALDINGKEVYVIPARNVVLVDRSSRFPQLKPHPIPPGQYEKLAAERCTQSPLEAMARKITG